MVDCLQGYEYSGDVGHTIVSEVGARRHSAFKRRRRHTLVLESQFVNGVFQWDLVCGKEALVEMSQTIMVIGVMIGAMVFTAASDAIGRKPVFLFR